MIRGNQDNPAQKLAINSEWALVKKKEDLRQDQPNRASKIEWYQAEPNQLITSSVYTFNEYTVMQQYRNFLISHCLNRGRN